jgi:hypothetical protein
VADIENNRVEEFTEGGEYITQFGTSGTGPGQFGLSWPVGLTTDAAGDIWVTDPGSNRIEKWKGATVSSFVATEVSIDGKLVDSGAAACVNESCSIASEWALDSSSYSAGPHTVSVKATDGVGRVTTKKVTIEVQRDLTKPTLEASGTLFEAPMGWVEQQDYSVTGKAQDAGAGLTQMRLMIDGKQAGSRRRVASKAAVV